MAHQDDFLLADTAQIFDKCRDVGNIVRESYETKAVEGAGQSELKHREAQLGVPIERFGNGTRVGDSVRPVS